MCVKLLHYLFFDLVTTFGLLIDFSRDCYRRFIQMYSDVVMEVGKKYFEELIDGTMAVSQVPGEWNRLYKEYLGVDVPDDRQGCLQDSIGPAA